MTKNSGTLGKHKATAKAPVTSEHLFASCNADRTYLFSVNYGVSCVDALSEVSCILAEVKAQLQDAGMENIQISANHAWLLHRAIEAAKAVVDSVQDGLESAA